MRPEGTLVAETVSEMQQDAAEVMGAVINK